MKRILPAVQITLLIATALVFMSNRGGSPGGRTGSPNDGSSCGTSGGCHGSSQGAIVQDFISTDMPSSGYEPGKSHTITLSPALNGRSTWGFEIVAEDVNGNKVGEFISNDDGNALQSGTRATHKFASSTGTDGRTWNLTWKAPAEGTGEVTFYAASLAANGNGNTGGDRVILDDLSVDEGVVNNVSMVENISVVLYPNPTTSELHIEGETAGLERIYIFNAQGVAVLDLPFSNVVKVDELTSGNYFIKLLKGNKSITKSFLKH